MAKKIVNTKNITNEEWLKLRKQSIGGSDAASCVNMNEYKSKMTLYADKLELSKPFDGNEATKLGTYLEDFVAKEYEERTGNKVRNDFFMYMDDEYDFITANVDRRIIGENAGLECKTMGRMGSYNLEGGEVPAHYFCQCQHYMMVLGFDYMDLAIYVLQKGLYINRIKRDDDFIGQLRNAEVDFWKEHIEKCITPAPDGSDSSIDTLKALYRDSEDTEIVIPDVDSMIAEYRKIKDMAKELDKQANELQAKICFRLGNNEVGIGTKYGCSWKQQSKTVVDTKRLKEEMPEIFSKYSKNSEYRVFRTKKLRG